MGYMTDCNCVMTSRIFKTFKYSDDVKETKCPDLNFDVKAKIRATDLILMVKSFKNFGESVKFKIKEDILNFSLKNDLYNISLDIPLIEVKINESLRDCLPDCKYGLDFLEAVIKEYPIKDLKNEEVVLSFSSDYPLLIDIKGDNVLIAPRVNND